MKSVLSLALARTNCMRLGFIYISGFLFLLIHVENRLYTPMRKKSLEKPPRLMKVYHNKRLAALVEGYVWGGKKGIGRKLKKAHRRLNLLHLFTPSGLHFSSLAMVALVLAGVLRRWHHRASWAVVIPLYAVPLLADGYYAAKRIVEYHLVKNLLRSRNFKIDSFWIFLGVFALDFCVGTYRHNPVSYCLSYLFLGIFFCLKDTPKIYWPFALLGGQILVAFCFETPLTCLGFYFGFFLTGIFTIIFPVILINNLLPYFNFSEFLVDKFIFLVECLASVSVSSGFFYPEVTIVIVTIMLALRWRCRLFIALLLLLTSFPAYNVPGYVFRAAKIKGIDSFLETSPVKRALWRGELNR